MGEAGLGGREGLGEGGLETYLVMTSQSPPSLCPSCVCPSARPAFVTQISVELSSAHPALVTQISVELSSAHPALVTRISVEL